MNGKRLLSILIVLSLLLAAGTVQAQEPDEHGDSNLPDPTVAPLVVPDVGEFLPPATDQTSADEEGDMLQPDGAGATSYFEVTSDMQAGVVAPYYRFKRRLALKVHVPIIFSKTYHYFGTDVDAGGIGDITVDGEYVWPLHVRNGQLRTQFSVKLPTGDDEKTTEEGGFEYATPLGTGTTDIIARTTFSKSWRDFGLLLGGLYRTNSAYDRTWQSGTMTTTTSTTAGDIIVGSAFARYRVAPRWWLHLGASVTILGDGDVESTTHDTADGSSTTSTWEIDTSGTLLDLFPGISYELGAITPFIGARIPVSTDYDNDLASTERDASLIVQISYSPQQLMP